MGRTNPTYRDALCRLESEWEPMRTALRREYQADFDRLFDRGRTFADAAGYANPPEPERALVLSLLLAHEVELRRLRAELEAGDGSGSDDRDGSRLAADGEPDAPVNGGGDDA